MKEETISRIAIIMLAIVMAVFGVYHFLQPENLIVWVPNFLPGGRYLWIYVAGAAFILAALALITNKQVKLAGYVLAGILFLFVLTIHVPTYVNAGDKEMQQLAFVNLLKDTAIAAFAMHIAATSTKK